MYSTVRVVEYLINCLIFASSAMGFTEVSLRASNTRSSGYVLFKSINNEWSVSYYCVLSRCTVLKLTESLLQLLYSYVIQGTSVKYSPQRVGINHIVQHEDVIQIVKK